MEPSRTTVKRLFAYSRNHCAFPECNAPIVEVSGTTTGIICHIRARSKGGPRYSAKQTDEERHAFENLILMCARHSKVIDTEPRRYTVKVLESLKQKHEQPASNELSVEGGRRVDLLLSEYRDLYINATNIYIEQIRAEKLVWSRSKTPQVAPPEGSIGNDLAMRNYAKYLIDQYNDFASKQPMRKMKFSFAAIHKFIWKRYAVSKWELIPQGSFEDLCKVLQSKIQSTWLGRINSSKGYKSFSTFADYQNKYSR